MNSLVVLDWGTSSLRAALLDANGQVLQERASAQGILNVKAGGFPEVFMATCGDWMQEDRICLISGMAGSRQGWLEAPYCPCPGGLEELVRSMVWLASSQALPWRIGLVPGMSCERDGVPDVMRGEEVQIMGAAQLLGLREATMILPGTHSKWVRFGADRIEHFSTFMTGEFYALLRQHSILSRGLPAEDGALDLPGFDEGVERALSGASLLQTAFSTRTLALFERRPIASLPSYLSGLVIGEELRAQPDFSADRPCIVIGSGPLTARYQRALGQKGISAQTLGAQAGWQGLWSIACKFDGESPPR